MGSILARLKDKPNHLVRKPGSKTWLRKTTIRTYTRQPNKEATNNELKMKIDKIVGSAKKGSDDALKRITLNPETRLPKTMQRRQLVQIKKDPRSFTEVLNEKIRDQESEEDPLESPGPGSSIEEKSQQQPSMDPLENLPAEFNPLFNPHKSREINFYTNEEVPQVPLVDPLSFEPSKIPKIEFDTQQKDPVIFNGNVIGIKRKFARTPQKTVVLKIESTPNENLTKNVRIVNKVTTNSQKSPQNSPGVNKMIINNTKPPGVIANPFNDEKTLKIKKVVMDDLQKGPRVINTDPKLPRKVIVLPVGYPGPLRGSKVSTKDTKGPKETRVSISKDSKHQKVTSAPIDPSIKAQFNLKDFSIPLVKPELLLLSYDLTYITCPGCHELFYTTSAFNEHFKAKHANLDETSSGSTNGILWSDKLKNLHHLQSQWYGDKQLVQPSPYGKEKVELTCGICAEKFANLMMLEFHVKKFHWPIKCEICNIFFTSFTLYNKHKSSMHNEQEKAVRNKQEKPVSNELNNKQKLEMHNEVVKMSTQNQLKCIFCSREFGQKIFLDKHYDNVHFAEEILKCFDCQMDAKVDPKQAIALHKKDGVYRVFRCGNCSEKYKGMRQYKYGTKRTSKPQNVTKLHEHKKEEIKSNISAPQKANIEIQSQILLPSKSGEIMFKCQICGEVMESRKCNSHHHKGQEQTFVARTYKNEEIEK